MAVNCPNCGNEIKGNLPYCDLCHQPLEREMHCPQYPPAGPVSSYSERMTPPPIQPYAPRLTGEKLETYNHKLMVSALVLAAAGILLVCCTFLPWMGVDFGFGVSINASGWDVYHAADTIGANPFYLRFSGVSVFSGLSSLLIGIAMAGLAGALMIWRRLELAYVIFPVTFLALGVALINTFNIWRIGFSLGVGSILLLLASIAGIVSGIFIRSTLAD